MSALIERIQKSVILGDGDCWIWTGSKQSRGVTPSMQWNKKVGNVRRFILVDKGIPVKGFFAWPSCGNFECVNPDHVIRVTRGRASSELAQRATGADRIMRCVNTARAIRKSGTKLTMEAAKAIRMDDRPQRVIAAEYGVTQHTIFSIKHNTMWREYTASPFTGMTL